MTDFTTCKSCGTVRDDLESGLCCECYQEPEETEEIELMADGPFLDPCLHFDIEHEDAMDEQRADARRRFRDEDF